MKHRPLLFLVLPLLFLAMALVAISSFSGSGRIASAHTDTGQAHIEIDLVLEADTDWCDPVTTQTTRQADGSAYQIAICLSDAESAPAGFQFDLLYDPSLNRCDDLGGSALDDNPDANDGTTTFTTPDLGTGWNCNVGDVAPPVCAKGNPAQPGRAFIKCLSAAGPWTLPYGADVSAPLAIVTLHAVAAGTDNLDLVDGHVVDSEAGAILDCGIDGGPLCYGATEIKEGEPPEPSATPTATATPQATATPCPPEGCPTSTPTPRAKTRTPTPGPTDTPGPAGEPTSAPPPPPPSGGQQPIVTPPSTGTGSDGIGWPGILMLTLAGGSAFSLLLGGGLYLRRVANR